MSLSPTVGAPTHPALLQQARERQAKFENRIADAISRFAGSMAFVYISIVWFTLWIAIPVEDYPYGLLTMIVSLEAIFLSTFILISQNRADEKRQAVADHHWEVVQRRDEQIETFLTEFDKIVKMTEQIYEEFLKTRGGAHD